MQEISVLFNGIEIFHLHQWINILCSFQRMITMSQTYFLSPDYSIQRKHHMYASILALFILRKESFFRLAFFLFGILKSNAHLIFVSIN